MNPVLNTENRNRNGRRQDRGDDCYNTPKFKRKSKGVSTLGVKESKHTDPFMFFQNSAHKYFIVNYNHPINITYLIKELKFPLPMLMK